MSDHASSLAGVDELTDLDRQLLEFEGQGWRFESQKAAAIKDRFDLSATAYYQRLGALLNKPEALAADPVLVNRLRRLRDQRQSARSARRLAG